MDKRLEELLEECEQVWLTHINTRCVGSEVVEQHHRMVEFIALVKSSSAPAVDAALEMRILGAVATIMHKWEREGKTPILGVPEVDEMAQSVLKILKPND